MGPLQNRVDEMLPVDMPMDEDIRPCMPNDIIICVKDQLSKQLNANDFADTRRKEILVARVAAFIFCDPIVANHKVSIENVAKRVANIIKNPPRLQFGPPGPMNDIINTPLFAAVLKQVQDLNLFGCLRLQRS